MKASILKGINQPLVFEETSNPIPEADEVVVKVKAAALNHRDVWIQKGQYAGLVFPIILGSDGSGIVSAAGSDDNKHLIGKEVIINPSLNWGSNPRVQAKDYIILGLPKNGCLAEEVSIPSRLVHEKPAHLSFEQASALPLAGLTGYRASMVRAGIKSGETVLVTGAGGGVALFCIQFAIAQGCKVFVTSGSDEKIEKAIALGAIGGVNYKNEDWHKALVKISGGFDAIIDSACGDNFSKLVDMAKPGGRIAFYGATLGAFNSGVPAKIFWKQLDILGSTMGNDDEFKAMLEFVNKHKIVPVVDEVFPLVNAEAAMRKMDEGKQFGKIVLSL
ncbi:MAG: zinc-binding dehydrogenase [Bacteroidia bacterium]